MLLASLLIGSLIATLVALGVHYGFVRAGGMPIRRGEKPWLLVDHCPRHSDRGNPSKSLTLLTFRSRSTPHLNLGLTVCNESMTAETSSQLTVCTAI